MYKDFINRFFDLKYYFEHITNYIWVNANVLIPLKENDQYTKDDYIASWLLIKIFTKLMYECKTEQDLINLINKQLNDEESKQFPMVIEALNKFLNKITN